MKRMLLFCVLALVAGVAQMPTDKTISYRADHKSVQYVVIDLAKRVNLDYDWDQAAAQTDPERRQAIDRSLMDVERPCDISNRLAFC
jgi:hypothetical protein